MSGKIKLSVAMLYLQNSGKPLEWAIGPSLVRGQGVKDH